MVRLLALAVGLALVLPVRGAARDLAQFVANGAVFLLFFLNGLRLPRGDVRAGMGNHRLLWPLVGWVFGAMGLAGWLLWQGGQGWMPHLLALGFLYLGCLPSTVQSATAYSSLAGGNVASSVVAAALLNILGVFITAPLFSLLAGSGAAEFRAEGLVKVVTTAPAEARTHTCRFPISSIQAEALPSLNGTSTLAPAVADSAAAM